MKKLFGGVLPALLLVLGLSGTANAAPPPTTPSLQGETLVSNPPDHRLFTHCNPDGTGYIAYAAWGPAAGPYTGYFAEVGRLTITSVTAGTTSGNFQAAFYIRSFIPPASIQGTKTATFTGVPVLCQSYGPPRFLTTGFIYGGVTYKAAIQLGEDRTCHDSGLSSVTALATALPAYGFPNAFMETFDFSNNGLAANCSSDGGDNANGGDSGNALPNQAIIATVPAPITGR